jgi:L-fuculose-phosphate aldolase
MRTVKVKEDICRVGALLYERHLISGTEGNISVRLSDSEIWTTPSGTCKGHLTPDELVRVKLDGEVISAGQASSELKMHLAIYRQSRDIKAIVHAHPIYAGAYAAARKALDQYYMTEAMFGLGAVPVAAYCPPSTKELAESITPFLSGKAALLANHGAVSWAGDLMKAYYIMDSLEASAKIRFLAEQIGGVKL